MRIEQVIEICYDIAKKHGFDGIIFTPIRVNARLTRTLGRVNYDEFGVSSIEFSQKLLDMGTQEQIMDTILHELAHAFVFWKYHEYHGHDAVWKAMAAELGASPTRLATGDIYQAPAEEVYKYTIYCPECRKIVASRSRACKITKNPELFFSKCCHKPVVAVQNW